MSFSGLEHLSVDRENQRLETVSSEQRVEWALETLPSKFILSSSFGIQSAVLLHLVTKVAPNIPVLLVDTGYLFKETYQFMERLDNRLNLNLKIVSSMMTPARLEATYGKLWEQGEKGLEEYNRLMKVEPMEQALQDMDVRTWFAGLRREQSDHRSVKSVIETRIDGRFKVYPLIDWTNKDIHQYLEKHNLPYHPLWEKGYVSVGDYHTSVPLTDGMDEQDTRFFGLKRECGLHT